MKKLLLVLPLVLLAGCGQSTTALPNDGIVVTCEDVATVASKSEVALIQCLDGGRTINASAIKGPVLLNVWGSWCAPCKAEMPIFVDFYNKHSSQVDLLGISVEEADIEDARSFVKRYGVKWPNFYDAKGTTRGTLGMGVPMTLFIDEKGVVVHEKIGVVNSLSELEDLTKKHLGVEL